MVLVTHDSTVARRAQRIGVMKNGRLNFREQARTQQVRAQARAGRGTRCTCSSRRNGRRSPQELAVVGPGRRGRRRHGHPLDVHRRT